MKTIKSLAFILLISLFVQVDSYAQKVKHISEAIEILNKLSKDIENNMPITTNFLSETFYNGRLEYKTNGNISVTKNKFFLATESNKVWFDGKTLHTYIKDNNEVTITEPTADEINNINPYNIINLHKAGYVASVVENSGLDKDVVQIDLEDKTKGKVIRHISLFINKKTNRLNKIFVKYDDKKITSAIVIKQQSYKSKVDNALFTFNIAEYQNVEIIDLR